MVKVKICGLTRLEDIEKAIEYGADYLGFVFEPTSPRCIAANQDVLAFATERARKVAVFHRFDGNCAPGFDLVQAAQGANLAPRRALQVIRVASDTDLELFSMHDEGLLHGVVLDAFSPTEFGGSGISFDWAQAEAFVAICDLPIFLAGGLNPTNVKEAISVLHPYAVDVSSGIESAPGIKDWRKMRDFIQAAKG